MGDSDQRLLLRRAAKALAAPWLMGSTVALCCLLGVYLDRRLGWSRPLATIALIVCGVVGGGYQAYRMIMKALKD